MQNLLDKFKGVKVLVFGDVMLDQYWWGSVDRISPEAPVPIVSLDKKSLVAGGAANVSANIAGLGARAILVGAVGEDPEANDLRKILEMAGVSSDYLIETGSRPTCVKTRIIASSQQIVRLDRESIEDIETDLEEKFWTSLTSLIDSVDVVVISDYAKGSVTNRLSKRIIQEANRKAKTVLVDPKGKDYAKYKNANILTPNQKEALDASGLDYSDETTVERAGHKLVSDFDLEHLLITRGEKGMALFSAGGGVRQFATVARKVFDVTGAGDTVIATIAVALGSGFDIPEACKLANAAAGIVVERVGTSPIAIGELSERYLSKVG